MRKLDPQLEFLLDGGVAQLEQTGDAEASRERFGIESLARRGGKPKAASNDFDSISVSKVRFCSNAVARMCVAFATACEAS